jgi:GNAT superfamily N-acetyltransferase
LSGQQKADRVAVMQLADELVVVDIVLLPEFQNRGIGSQILKNLQYEAGRKNLSIRKRT